VLVAQRQSALARAARKVCESNRATHIVGIVAWEQTRMTNGFLDAGNDLLQAARCRARGFHQFDTSKSVIFLIAGKLNFTKPNPLDGQPT
jgi:Transposase